jgi:hypothetical protein
MILHNTREKRVSKTKEIKIIVRRNVTMFPIGEYVILHRKFSEHVSIVSGRQNVWQHYPAKD